MPNSKPWLADKKWSKNRIVSSAKMQHYVIWGFALVWLLLTSPVVFNAQDIWHKTQREPVTAVAFLFPLIGVGLIIAALRATRQWQRFGTTPLILDPFPGALGGHVGGTIETGIPFDAALSCSVSLLCVHSVMSGTGKNRRRHESIEWQSDGVCHLQSRGGATDLRFRFDVPADLPATTTGKASNYHVWRVAVEAAVDGQDFSRTFEIPVFNTGATSDAIEHSTEQYHATFDKAVAGVQSIATIETVPGGIAAYFPAFQRPLQGVMMVVFGLIFAAAGIGAGYSGAPLIFPLVFGVVGGFIFLAGVYYLCKSLRVEVTDKGIRARRFLFGYPLTTRQMLAADIRELEISQGASLQTGNSTTVFYRLYASNDSGQKIPVAERLASRAEVQVFKDSVASYLGIAG